MSRIRVVLADLSPMLASLISELIRSPQIEVVGGRSRGDLPALVAETGASVVIMPGDSGGLPGEGRRLLDDRASFRVLALRDHASSGVVGALTVRTVGIDDISTASLLRAVAGADLDADAAGTGPTSPSGGGPT